MGGFRTEVAADNRRSGAANVFSRVDVRCGDLLATAPVRILFVSRARSDPVPGTRGPSRHRVVRLRRLLLGSGVTSPKSRCSGM